MTKTGIAATEDIITAAAAGEMFILVDDEARENEGDICILANHADADAINFMARHARGLICLALTRQRIEQLGLRLMERRHESRHETAFTISIEAREGITTGISAHDRARTIAVATDPRYNAEHIATPGHVFPLMARDGGVLVRAGHTEAVADIARLAGMENPAGVICEIMKDDGSMARLPDLLDFAAAHNIKIGTIADLIAHRRKTETVIRRAAETMIETRYGGAWRMIIYVNTVSYAEHIALVKGDISSDAPVPVRMHGMNILTDVLGETGSGRTGAEIQSAMRAIAAEGRGAIVMLREPNATTLTDAIAKRTMDKESKPAGGEGEIRSYGVGAQILLDLGISEMILLSNTKRHIIGLEGYGLTIKGYRAIGGE